MEINVYVLTATVDGGVYHSQPHLSLEQAQADALRDDPGPDWDWVEGTHVHGGEMWSHVRGARVYQVRRHLCST